MTAFGIDLGTTFSSIAFIPPDSAMTIVADDSGRYQIPSFVRWNADDPTQEWDFGSVVKEERNRELAHVMYDIKRLIGRRFTDREIRSHIWPFKLLEHNKELTIELPRASGAPLLIRPWEIWSKFLGYLMDLGNSRFSTDLPVKDAVITVPAHFNKAQRTETRQAAQSAGINVLRLFNEPTAAALALQRLRPGLGLETVLVYDFGGGTLDVSLIDAREEPIRVLGTDGDTSLGGRDFDEPLVSFCRERFESQYGVQLDEEAIERLTDACEEAKETLSEKLTVNVNVPNIFENITLNQRVTRAKFEDMCSDIFDRCLPPVDRVLAVAGKKPEDVDQIILVGGSSVIPKVHLLIEGKLGKKPFQGVAPREAVVQGAAFLADQLKQTPDSVAFYDICPLTIGMEVEAGEFLPVIWRNKRIPTSGEVTVRTAEYGQTEADLRVFEGERELCADNHLIGTYTIQGIPPTDPTQIEPIVTFHLDLEGILEIEAHVKFAGESEIKLTVMAEPYELAPHRMHSLQMPRTRRHDRSCAFQWQLVAFCRGARRYLQKLQNDGRFRPWVNWDRLQQYMARLDMEERRAAVSDDLPSRKLKHNLSRMLSLWLIHTQAFLPPSLDLSPGASCEFEDDWVE
jgi:molecular chaperone DnaK (HSP70)